MIDEKAARAESGVMHSIFQQPWWVEAAAGTALQRAEVRWGGQVVASLPFIRVKRVGFTLLEMPPLYADAGANSGAAGEQAGETPAQYA